MQSALLLMMGWFRLIGDRLLAVILRVSVEENMADLTQASLAAKRRTVETALEALEFANGIDVADDEFKAKLMSEFKSDIADITAVGRGVLSGVMTPEAGRESLGKAPFEPQLSGTHSANKPKPLARPETVALPDRTDPEDNQPQPPRRRGRPPKHPRPEATA